jgi:PAS domain S-box-containing protein
MPTSHDELSRLAHLVSAPLIIIDADYCVTEANPAALEALGYAYPDFVGKKLTDFIADDTHGLARILRICARHNAPLNGRLYLYNVTGVSLGFPLRASIIRNGDQNISALYALELERRRAHFSARKIKDAFIAEEGDKRAQEDRDSLQRIAQEWVLAMDFFDDAIYLLDNDRRLLRANKAFYRMMHATPAQCVGRDIRAIMHPKGEEILCPVCQAQAEKCDAVITLEADHPDNPTRMPLEVKVKILRDRHGESQGILMSIHDLSNSRRINDALLAATERLQLAQEIAKIGTFEYDFNKHASYWTDSLLHLYGLKRMDFPVAVRDWLHYIHIDDRACVREALRQAEAGGQFAATWRIQRADGSQRYIEGVARTLEDIDGRPRRMIGINMDITERYEHEAVLQESAARYRALFEDSPIALWEEDFSAVKELIENWRRNGETDLRAFFQREPERLHECARAVRVIHVNQAALDLYGAVDVSQLRGSLDKVFTEESMPVFRNEILVFASGESAFSAESRQRTLDGRMLWASVRAVVPAAYAQSWQKIFVSTIDLSARKRAEDELWENRQRLELMQFAINNMADSAFIIDPLDARFTYVNAAACKTLGYTYAEFVKLGVRDIDPEFIEKDWHEHMDDIREQGSLRFESAHRHKNGTVLPVEVFSNYYVYGGDEFILSFSRDISERKRLDAELQAYREHLEELVRARTAALETEMFEREQVSASLRETETHFRKTFELSGDALYISDITGRFLNANATACRELGYDLAELQQLCVTDIDVDFKQHNAELKFLETLPTQESVTFETKHRRKDGSCFPVEINLSFLPKGDSGWLFASCRNIATRKQLEETLRRAKDTAEEASRAKSLFLANMSHELRTPMNAILGFAQLMRHDAGLNNEQRANLDTINRSGQHLLALINDVLEISKIEAGQPVLHYEIFDIYEMLTSLKEMMGVRAHQKDLVLRVEQCQDLPRYLRSDAQKLRQVLVNLMGNAIKFTSHGEISLGLTWNAQNNSLSCHVRDSGCGISADERERVFAAFYQSREAAKLGEGTGLGLTISREYIRLLGADLQLDSTPGQGSCFYFTIPVEAINSDDTPPELTRQNRRVLSLAPGQPEYRILVVEDNHDNRRLLLQLLENAGFKVRQAANGVEAIKMFQSWHPHLIWMDMRMPVLDGYEATRRIKALQNGHNSIIIALTASAFEEERAAILTAGCDDFLRKPVDAEILFDLMQRYLNVRYVYAANEAPTTDIAPEIITELPPALRDDLYHAALHLDVENIRALLAQVNASAPQAGAALERLAREYRYDKIQELCQPAQEKSDNL